MGSWSTVENSRFCCVSLVVDEVGSWDVLRTLMGREFNCITEILGPVNNSTSDLCEGGRDWVGPPLVLIFGIYWHWTFFWKNI